MTDGFAIIDVTPPPIEEVCKALFGELQFGIPHAQSIMTKQVNIWFWEILPYFLINKIQKKAPKIYKYVKEVERLSLSLEESFHLHSVEFRKEAKCTPIEQIDTPHQDGVYIRGICAIQGPGTIVCAKKDVRTPTGSTLLITGMSRPNAEATFHKRPVFNGTRFLILLNFINKSYYETKQITKQDDELWLWYY